MLSPGCHSNATGTFTASRQACSCSSPSTVIGEDAAVTSKVWRPDGAGALTCAFASSHDRDTKRRAAPVVLAIDIGNRMRLRQEPGSLGERRPDHVRMCRFR